MILFKMNFIIYLNTKISACYGEQSCLKSDHSAPMQIQANRHDICSDISREHV